MRLRTLASFDDGVWRASSWRWARNSLLCFWALRVICQSSRLARVKLAFQLRGGSTEYTRERGSSTLTSVRSVVMSVCSWKTISQEARGCFAREYRRDQNWTNLKWSRKVGDQAIGGRPHFCSARSMCDVSLLSIVLMVVNKSWRFGCVVLSKEWIVSVRMSWWQSFPSVFRYF